MVIIWETCCLLSQMILAVGGMGRRELAGTPSIELYDPSTKQWHMLSQMASGRWGAGLVTMPLGDEEELIYLVGGSNESSRLSSVQRYTISSDMWSSARDMALARNGVGVVTYEGKEVRSEFCQVIVRVSLLKDGWNRVCSYYLEVKIREIILFREVMRYEDSCN